MGAGTGDGDGGVGEERSADAAVLTGGLEILAGTSPVRGGPFDGKTVPVLVFRFYAPDDGGVYPDIMLAVPREEITGLWRDIRRAGEAAVAESDRLNGVRR